MNIINLRITLLSTVIMALPVFVQAIDYTYVTNGSAITITGYTGTVSDITIPSSISGLPVVTIGQSAFSGSAITSVDIPTSVTNIEPFAFKSCGGLISVSIPNSVVTMGTGTFYQCTGLASVDLPRDIETLEAGLLAGCSSLESISIPSKVGVIEYAAFADCLSLTDMVLPNSVTDVQQNVFPGCSSLQTILVGKNLHTFDLTPSGIYLYGGQLLSGCNSLTDISVDKQNNYFSSDDGVLLDKDQTQLIFCPSGKSGSYTVPSSITNIGDSAFFGCEALTNIFLPDGLISIGLSAFLSCSGLTNMTIPSSVTFIDRGGFYACNNLREVSIPQGIQSISGDLFRSCSSLIHVTIPDGVTNIEYKAFADCTSLGYIRIPSSVLNIGKYAFGGCPNLTSLMFEGHAPLIGDGTPGYIESLFSGTTNVVSFYLSGKTGWGTTFGDRPAVMWNAQVDTLDPDFGIHTNGFRFSVTGPTNLPITVDASATLVDPAWESLKNVILTNGLFGFTDEGWTNYSSRFYRVSAP